MAINVNELTPLKLYSNNNKLYLPILEKDKRHGSVIFLLAPDHESALNILETPYLVNRKCYESYYTEKDINLIINHENKTIGPNQYITESNNINKLLDYYKSGKYIFHGSPIQNLKTIDTHVSKSYSNLGPIIFASPQPNIAACFMLDWNDTTMKLGTDENQNPSCWFIKDYHLFNIYNPGSIYVLDKQSFNKMDNFFEMYSNSKSLPVIYEEKFDNILDALKLFNIDFYDYNTKKKIFIESENNAMNKITALNNQMNIIPYGYYINKKRIDLATEKEWYEKYRTQDPNNVITNNGGVCWDFTGYEAMYFKKEFSNIEYHCYFIQLEDNSTHTFLVFKYNNKYYYFESSFKTFCGIWESQTLEDIFNFIVKNMCLFNGYDVTDFKIYEYDATDKRLYQNLDTVQYETMILKIGKRISHKYNDNKRNVSLLESFTEVKLSSKEKKSFDNNIYGLPKEKKYPMPDANHVRSAISYFTKCPEDKKKELAKNIKKKAKQFGVEINKDSPINKYTGDEIINEIK